MNAATIYLVDDDLSVREALTLLFAVSGHKVLCCASGEAFLALTLAEHACVVLDLNLGGMGGLAVLEALVARGNPLPVILLTAHGDIRTAVRAMRTGACDFISKTEGPEVLLARVNEVLQESVAGREARREAGALRISLASLSAREREILHLAIEGLDTRTTAERLNISARTVEVHRSHIAQKCGVENLASLFRIAARMGQSLEP